MSLTITVRANDAKTGGDNHELPADGDNGNQEIDTKSEAEAALLFVTDDKLVAVVGEKTYKREELIAIRDKNAEAVKVEGKAEGDVPSPDAKTPTQRGSGVSIGIGLDGYYSVGLGENGLSGGGAQLTGRFGIPLLTSNHLLALDIIGGGDVGGFASSEGQYTTPGGEPVESAFTGGGVVAGAMLRWQSPWIIGLAAGVLGEVGGFGTPASTEVSLPPTCTPGDFGRGECEPNAGPRTGNSGTTGLYNPDLGASRGTDGILIKVEAPIVANARVLEDSWGALDIFAGGKFGYTFLSPSDGHSMGYPTVGVTGGVTVRFGGTDAVVPSKPDDDADGDGVADADDKCAGTPTGTKVDEKGCELKPVEDSDKDGVGDADDKCPDVAGTKENKGCPAYDAKVTSFPDSLKPGDKLVMGLTVSADSKVTIKFTDSAGTATNTKAEMVDAGNATPEFSVPSNLTSGKYKVTITMKDPTTGVEKVEEKEVVIVEKVTATLQASFAPGEPPAVQDVKVVGLPKLDGVNYVVQGVDKKTGAVVGEQAVADKPGSIFDSKGTRVGLQAPGKGFVKDVTYTVTLKNKEGQAIWSGQFEIGEAPPAPKGGGGKTRRRA